MGNNNEKSISPEERDLFHKVAQDIKDRPARYREAGKWLDEYCSEEAYWRRQEKELKELRRKEREFSIWPIPKQVRQLEQEIEQRRTPALAVRFQEARDYLFEKYKQQQFIPEDDAKRIILIAWLLTDPDAEKADLAITELEKWTWEPIDDALKMSRGYANFSWFHGGRVYGPWMNLVRIACVKLKRGRESWYQTSTFKFVVIPIVTTIFIGVPTWISLTKDSQTTSNSYKEVEEKPAEIEEVAGPPILSLSSKEINQTGSGYVALLKFEPSKNQALREISFVAKIVDGSRAKIINFSPVGISMDVLKKIAPDGKEAQLTYTITGGYPKLKLETSDTGKVMLSGSHIAKPIILEID